MVKIIKINKDVIDRHQFSEIINHLQDGGILLYPTDTSYGAGVLIKNTIAVDNLSKLKQRPEEKKYSEIVPSIEWAMNTYQLDTRQRDVLSQYLPGPYTFVVKESNAIRIPDYSFVQKLVKELNQPITATSANISSQSDAYSLNDLQIGILSQSDINEFDILVLDGGQLQKGSRSTIVDTTKNPPIILRQGSGDFTLA